MSSRWAARRAPGGGILPSSLPKGTPALSGKANGQNFRGVVLALTGYGETIPPFSEANAIYATVLTYGKFRTVIPRVLVTQPHGGPQSGQVGGIRPSSITIGPGDAALNPDYVNPADCDGTHVVVSFFDDDFSLPFISAILPHPRVDEGHATTEAVGDRLRVTAEEAAYPLLTKHNGAVWGLDANGDFLLDLEAAHTGRLVAGGTEPTPAVDGSRGNYRVRLPVGARVILQIGGGATLEINQSAGLATLVLGNGARRVAVSEPLEALYNSLASYVQNAQVLTALGVSGTILAQRGPAPTWDPAINSSKMSLPET